jgi:hypothetical protein
MAWYNNLGRLYERDAKGNHNYFVDSEGNWSNDATNIKIAQDHPILTGALLFRSQLFSSGKFKLKKKSDDEIIKEHWILDLLEYPNTYQTKSDFLEALAFSEIAEGKCVVWGRVLPGFDEPDELHILEQNKIKWPLSMKNDPFYDFEASKEKVIYSTGDGTTKEIPLNQLIIFYDLPNGLQTNRVEVKSRLDGLKQTLINTHDSLVAKNVILKTNGKELITGEKGQTMLSAEEQTSADNFFSNRLGLARNRLRALITRSKITWKSLHIALRDLGLDESVKVDGNLIYTTLHIPKDILSLEAKKTTYNNFKESMVSYIQNDIQSKMNSVCSKLIKQLDKTKTLKLEGSYEHLPVMQFVRIERYESVKKQADALMALRKTGISDELALEMCDFEKGTVLKPMKDENKNKNSDKSSNKKRAKGKVRQFGT